MYRVSNEGDRKEPLRKKIQYQIMKQQVRHWNYRIKYRVYGREELEKEYKRYN